MTLEVKRPLGVTVVGALTLLGGIVIIATGIASATIPSYLENISGLTRDEMSDTLFGAIAAAVMLALLIPLGVGFLIVGFGALKGKKWAWPALLIVHISSIVLSIVVAAFGDSSTFGSIIVGAFIIAYLFTKQAKAYFGRLPANFTPQSAPSDSGATT